MNTLLLTGWNDTYTNKRGLFLQQPSVERHDRNGYSMMLKLFRSIERDNEATEQTGLVAAICQATKLPVLGFCIPDDRSVLTVSFLAGKKEYQISSLL